ncbi:MAG: hypothetical protein ABIS67_14015 [Candidatus Eisenbacteria bacterium]
MRLRSLTAVGIVVLVLAAAPGCGKKGSPAQPGGSTPADPFNSGVFSLGSSPNVFVHTFTAEGSYGYFCSIHGSASSGMRGTIHVAAGMPESSSVNVADDQFIPSAQNVRPGGYIKWSATGGNHTVTR